MFTKYHPTKGEMLQILSPEGKIINTKFQPEISTEKVLQAYKLMVYTRTVDLKTVSYQRQGRMYTYAPNFGQEASMIGTGFHMNQEDWLVPSYREMGAFFHRGVTPTDIWLYWGGHEDGAKFPKATNTLPISVPIASQIIHAAGIGYGLKLQKQKGIVYTYFGDGGTSEGDFHAGLNFASVWKAPVIFICQNNQYAISLRQEKQMASSNIAIKSLAYGMPGIQVDGNDFFACYSATQKAAQHIEEGKGPVLIEALTYRRGAHTTADDPSRYRSKEEEKIWEEKDPILRLKRYLVAQKLWSEEDDTKLTQQYEEEVEAEFLEYEKYPPYELNDVFQYLYNTMPDDLVKQKQEYEKYLAWKESRS